MKDPNGKYNLIGQSSIHKNKKLLMIMGNIQEIIKIRNEMVEVFIIGKQEIFIKDNGQMGNNVEKEFIQMIKDINIKVNGFKEFNMVMEYKFGKVEKKINTKDNLKKDKEMVKVYISIKMEILMMDIGRKELKVVKVS